MKVSVGIKALNEEKNIAAAILSALEAVAGSDGEVILADSGSEDRTVEVAQAFPIRIYQLADIALRCCGAGAQLAFQHARGDYFYLLDGDMQLEHDFLSKGVEYLEKNPDVAGVGGHVRECNVSGEEFQIRAMALKSGQGWAPGEVDRLDCGGLYRRSALVAAGYFTDRNLHSFEEFELGARLRAAGWKLARIDHPAVSHFGHTAGGYRLLWRRVRSGYSNGPGEVLRSAVGKPHLRIVLRRLSHLRIGAAIVVWWLLLMACAWRQPVAIVPLILCPLIFLAWRRRSFKLGLYSLASWNVSAWGMLAGFFAARIRPDSALQSIELKGAPEASDAAGFGLPPAAVRDANGRR